jgi:hypothetical protein
LAAFSELVIEQGSTFSSLLNVEDSNGDAINLYAYTANSQMRKSYYSSSYTVITSTVTGTSNGEITLSMTAANTSSLTPGRYVYDVIITSPTNAVTRVVEGIVTVLPSVTR